MGKHKEKPASTSRNKGGKPRKYGPTDGQICRPMSLSVPAGLIMRLESAAIAAGVGRSDLAVSLLESGLAEQHGPQEPA